MINAAAGALVDVLRPSGWTVLDFDEDDAVTPRGRPDRYRQPLQRALPEMFETASGLTCGICVSRELIEDTQPACEALDLADRQHE